MLKVENLDVRYGSVNALKDASIEVNSGEIVGVVGPNGAGKSTLLMSIAGLVPPNGGSISFEGRSLVGLRPDAIVRRGIAIVPEGRRIFGTLTVAENLRVAFSARNKRIDGGVDVERVLDLFPALKNFLSSSAGRLSGGEQQQLAIARALLTNPRLLLVDEPSLGLAPIIVDRVFDLLSELRETGMTILLVEQNASQAHAISNRMYVLRTGRVELLDAKTDLLKAIATGELYFGVAVADAERSELGGR